MISFSHAYFIPLILSDSLSDYPVRTLLALVLEYSLPQS